MKHESSPPAPAPGEAVVLLGGSGALARRYRDVVEARGLRLRHYENRMPAKARRGHGRVAIVVVMIGMVSHALAAHARSLGADARIVYLRSASPAALAEAVEGV